MMTVALFFLAAVALVVVVGVRLGLRAARGKRGRR